MLVLHMNRGLILVTIVYILWFKSSGVKFTEKDDLLLFDPYIHTYLQRFRYVVQYCVSLINESINRFLYC